jgi:hypothetical protein
MRLDDEEKLTSANSLVFGIGILELKVGAGQFFRFPCTTLLPKLEGKS